MTDKIDTSPEAVERLAEWEQGVFKHHGTARTLRALSARVTELEGRERMIVSHATGGKTTGVGMSINDISVGITRLRNKVYEGGKQTAEQRAAELEAKLAKVRAGLKACRATFERIDYAENSIAIEGIDATLAEIQTETKENDQ